MAVLIVGCQAQAGSPDAPPTTPPADPELDVTSPESRSDSLDLRLRIPDRVPTGQPIPMTLLVENVSGRPLDLYLRGRTIAFDLVVATGEGEVVWRRLHDEVIPAILRMEPLSPGRTLELGDSWDQRSNAGKPLAPGSYRVHGELLTEGKPLITPERVLRIGSD